MWSLPPPHVAARQHESDAHPSEENLKRVQTVPFVAFYFKETRCDIHERTEDLGAEHIKETFVS